MQKSQSKNDYVLYRSTVNEELHNAIMSRDTAKIEAMLEDWNNTNVHGNVFSLFDVNSVLDIEFVRAEHEKEIAEDDFEWLV